MSLYTVYRRNCCSRNRRVCIYSNMCTKTFIVHVVNTNPTITTTTVPPIDGVHRHSLYMPCGIFWLPLVYLLVTPVVSSDYSCGIFCYPCGIFWLPLWYLLITPVVSSGSPCGIFWLPLWYLLITPVVSSVTPVVSSGYPCGIFLLPLWYLLVTPVVRQGW
jgi:hypothetical protein